MIKNNKTYLFIDGTNLYAGQFELFGPKKYLNFSEFIRTGYRSKTSGKEKEVDVKLAVDIVEKAARNQYDSLFLMSGDADFMEALFSAKRFSKKVSILCIQNKIMFKGMRFFPFFYAIFSGNKCFYYFNNRATKLALNTEKVTS